MVNSKQVAADFEEQWAEGKIDAWKLESQENGHVNASIDLDFYDTVEELVAIGGRQIEGVKGHSTHFLGTLFYISFASFYLLINIFYGRHWVHWD